MTSIARTAAYLCFASCSLASGISFAQPPVIKATLLDNAIQLDASTVKAGKVTFEVSNASEAKMVHEMVVLKTPMADDKLPVKTGEVPERQFKKMGEVEDVAVGKSKRLTLRLAAGHYVLICNKSGHYQMGLHTSLTVTP